MPDLSQYYIYAFYLLFWIIIELIKSIRKSKQKTFSFVVNMFLAVLFVDSADIILNMVSLMGQDTVSTENPLFKKIMFLSVGIAGSVYILSITALIKGDFSSLVPSEFKKLLK